MSTATASAALEEDYADTHMSDAIKSQAVDVGAEARRVTIYDLPPEIVLAIAEQVDFISAQDRLWPSSSQNATGAHGAAGNVNDARGAPADDEADGGINAADLFADMMNNLLGGMPRAAATGDAPAPAAGAPANAGANNNNGDDDDEMPPLGPLPTAPRAANPSPSATRVQQQQHDDDDMPPLEPINGPRASAPRPASAAAAAARPAPAASATNNSRTGSTFLSAFSNPLAAFAGLTGANRHTTSSTAASGTAPTPTPAATPSAPAPATRAGNQDDDDDDMPPLVPIEPATPASSSRPARPAASATADRSVARGDSDDEMPPLEPINASSSDRARPTSTRRAEKSGEETEDDMPELEPNDSQRVSDRPRLAASGSATATARANPAASSARVTGQDDVDDDELPPLEPLDGESSPPSELNSVATVGPSWTALAASSATSQDNDEEMPPLEPINDDDDNAASATNGAATLAGSTGVNESAPAHVAVADNDNNDIEDGDIEEGDDEGDHEWEDEADLENDVFYDGDYLSSGEDEDRIFCDGLPTDPVVPLALVNRPFLHAARKVLYRHVAVPSAYVGVLVRETLSRRDPAGFVEGDKVLLPTKVYDDGKTKLERNVLCDMVRSLTFTVDAECSLGRGGGRVFIDLIRMCAENLELLTLRPMFMASATKPLLEALAELKRLKMVDINSCADPKRPFIVTTARVYKLLQKSWLDLERLLITDLEPSEEGPVEESDEMWEISDNFADAQYERLKSQRMAEGGEAQGVEAGEDVDQGATDAAVSPRPRGLKDLQLYGFNVTGTELSLILQDSKQTLRTLSLQRPSYLFKRTDLASTLLTFGHNLTTLDLYLPESWERVPKLLPGQSRPPFPVRPKDHEAGEPAEEYVRQVGRYTYLLDAVMPCLPNLTRLRFDGPHASAHVFAWFPEKLKTVSFSNCPTIDPGTLVKVLNKTFTRSKQVTKKDGSVGHKSFQTKAARGMTCLAVTNDDLSWAESDTRALRVTLEARDCCLHLTSESVHGGLLPLFGGFALGGLFGGAQRPADAHPAPRRDRANPAAL